MNWLKENPFVAGLIVALAAGCAGLGFLLSGALSEYTSTMDSYTSAVANLHQLQNKVPFPNADNLKTASALRDEYQGELDRLKKQLAALQVPIDPTVTPQQFQDDLRAAVNEITRRAEAAKIKLPDNFYLGFDSYRDSLPNEQAAPALARELGLVVKIVGDLIGLNPENPVVRSIDGFSRTPLPEEGQTAAAPNRPAGQGRPGRDNAEPKPDFLKMPLRISFTAEQGKFRIAINNLLRFPQFLIIRNLEVANSKPQGPPVTPAEQPATSAASLFAQPGENEKVPGLDVILGRENIQAHLEIELVDFRFPADAPTPAPQ